MTIAPARPPLIAHVQIGGTTSGRDDIRNIGVLAKWQGTPDWCRAVVDQIAAPAVSVCGADHVIAHNPWGTRSAGKMELDQLPEAAKLGLRWTIDGFAEAWRTLTDNGVPVIGYLGTPHADDSVSSRVETPGRKGKVLDHLHACLRLLLDAGMDFGCDWLSAEVSKTGSRRHYALARFLEEFADTRCWCEAWPLAADEHLREFPVLCSEGYYRASVQRRPELFAPREKLGTVVLWQLGQAVNGESRPDVPERPDARWNNLKEWVGEFVGRRWRAGFGVTFPAKRCVDAGINVRQLAEEWLAKNPEEAA